MALRRVEARRERRNKMMMSIFIVILMVASGFAVFLSGSANQTNRITENGLTFSINQQAPYYTTKIEGQEMSFYFLPSSVNNDVLTQVQPLLQNADFLVQSIDPSMPVSNLQFTELARYDISRNIPLSTYNAVTHVSDIIAQPVVTCLNSSVSSVVITYEEGEPNIVVNDSCIRVTGNTTSFMQARDQLLYTYWGVLP